MKRSNRLVLLVGVFLAVIAFVGVLLLSNQPDSGGGPDATPTTANVVVATKDIPLGTVIDETMVETKNVDIQGAEGDAFADVSQVIGQVARQEVLSGGQVTARTISGTTTTADLRVPPGMRAMSVRVDQVSGVGTLIKTGDYVDMVIRMEVQGSAVDPETGEVVGLEPGSIDETSTKLILQGLQVLGTLLPATTTTGQTGGASPQPGGATLNDRNEIVILALTPAQTEVVKFSEQAEAVSFSLVLRSPEDFFDAEGNPLTAESPCATERLASPSPGIPAPSPSGSPSPSASPVTPFPCEITPGVVLATLIDDYGVLSNNPPFTVNLSEVPQEVAWPSLNPDAFESPAP